MHDRNSSYPSIGNCPCYRQRADQARGRQLRDAIADGRVSVLIVFPAAFFVPLPKGNVIVLLVASGIIHATYELFLIKTYENGTISQSIPSHEEQVHCLPQ